MESSASIMGRAEKYTQANQFIKKKTSQRFFFRTFLTQSPISIKIIEEKCSFSVNIIMDFYLISLKSIFLK
jgi:hypothetical protein